MVQHSAIKNLWRVVVIVAMLLGMLPNRMTFASEKAVGEVTSAITSEALGLSSFESAAPASTDLLSNGPVSGSIVDNILPQFSDALMPFIRSADDLPPVDGEPGEDTGVTSPMPEPYTPDIALVPHSLYLTGTHTFLTVGQTVTLNVQARRNAQSPVDEVEMTVVLPTGLHLLKNGDGVLSEGSSGSTILTWRFPALTQDELFERQIEVLVEDGNQGESFGVEARLSAEGYRSPISRLVMGIPWENSELLVLPQNVTPGERGRALTESSRAATEVDATPAVEPILENGFTLHLPVVTGGINTQSGENDRFMRTWQVNRVETRQQDTDAEPVVVLVNVGPLATEGVSVSQLGLWMQRNPDAEWERVNARYDPDQQLFRASIYLPTADRSRSQNTVSLGLGNGLRADGILPTMTGFSTSDFTGEATISYPINAPAGLGGLQPGLSLNYSSGTIDSLLRAEGDHGNGSQGDWTGLGWSLGGMSYIARDLSNLLVERYFLVLNGMSAEIRKVNGQYITDPEQFLKIGGRVKGSDISYEDLDDWEITTPDGTKYSFGGDQFDGNGMPIGNWTETYLDNFYPNAHRETRRVGSRWYLRRVEDTLGNRMEYNYDRETTDQQHPSDPRGENYLLDVDSNCIWSSDVGLWYTQATYLRSVYWNANGAPDPQLRVELTRENRPDFKFPGRRVDECQQPQFGHERLRSIRVQASSGGSWQTLREVILNQSHYKTQQHDHSGHSRLDSIQEYGKGGFQSNGTNLLQTYSFNYINYGSSNHLRLQSADNGQGGKVTYYYDWFEVTNCSGNCTKFGFDTNGMPDHFRVKTTRLEDGQSPATVISITHTYADPKGNMVDKDRYEYLGHRLHQTWTFIMSDRAGRPVGIEQSVRNEYRQRTASGGVDPARGRVEKSYTYNGAGAMMQKSETTWAVLDRPNGSKWVRKDREKGTVYDWDGNNNEYSQRTDYYYESNDTSHFGNLIRMDEWNQAENQILRRTETEYFANAGTVYVVNRPARVRTYDEVGTCVGESRILYDGNGAYNMPPSKGLATQRLQKISGSCPSAATTISLSDNEWLITRYEYDGGVPSVGNVTREWVEGTSQNIVTDYDSTYRLFPIRRYNASNSNLDETAKYYGVNGEPLSNANAYWGQMQEFCGIDNICTQQAYDGFGRPTARWERGVGHPNLSSAQTRWFYWLRGSTGNASGDATNVNIVLEWNHPRCEGNFTRKLYNGFGQLIQSQEPTENWTTTIDGCNKAVAGDEVVVDYAYDALGRQIRQSVPRSVPGWNWATSAPWAANWGNGYTETTYDALGRPLIVESANHVTTQYIYTQRITSVDVMEEGKRRISWNETDELGRVKRIRSYYWSGSSKIAEGEIVFAYKPGTELITQVQFNDLKNSANNKALSTMTYDLAGRKLSMNDEDLGNWTYAYDKLGQLTRQTDARSKSTCLTYNALGQVTAKKIYNSGGCSSGLNTTYSYVYDSLGRLSSASGGIWSKSLVYDNLGRPAYETVTIDGIDKTTRTIYDAYQRPYATQYPDGEVVKVNFNSLGLPKLMCSSTLQSNGEYWCDGNPRYVDNANYDYAGRLYQMNFPAGGNLWRTQTYYGWGEAKNGGLLKEIKVGTSNGSSNRFYRQYTYNSFGDVATLKEGNINYGFAYDPMGRLASAYDNLGTTASDPLESFTYDSAARMTSGGKTYNAIRPYHAPASSSYGSHTYDSNGNLTQVKAGTTQIAGFTWNAENHLASATKNGVTESYAYDADGNRIKKTSGGVTARTFFAGLYEEEVSGTTTTVIKHYSFNGMALAVRRGGVLRYTHTDHLGSSSLATDSTGAIIGGSTNGPVSYYAYGSVRSGNPANLTTDRTFTGQKADGTGLLYYNARYYDPGLGTFLSPDTLVPDAGAVIDYNRFAYARNNPLKYGDPDGHCPAPPGEMGPTICVALFIKPDHIQAGPFVVHGDGRDFSSDSDPAKSRGYLWIPLDGSPAESHMNPSAYLIPHFGSGQVPMSPIRLPDGTELWTTDASDKNVWNVSRGEDGSITIDYDLVISGILEVTNFAPHINGQIIFRPDGKGGWESTYTRDGFPWAEAYYHDGNGNIQIIFQDPATRGQPHDLSAIEPNMKIWEPRYWGVELLQSIFLGEPQVSRKQ